MFLLSRLVIELGYPSKNVSKILLQELLTKCNPKNQKKQKFLLFCE
ncbi:hypothetical protein pah_c004o020 [Parachlamydia acanthamoebae str. Hall's coccus]|nr:hypothetical protein pah_c004o020 [Parachlamydia acanthamoebae str. Hall's coccus]